MGFKPTVVTMETFNYEEAKERYNTLMENTCWEHATIDTIFSENTEGWTIRDMVAECDYRLSTYYEEGHCNCDELKVLEPDLWRSETMRLKNFITKYHDVAMKFDMVTGHCSQYDK